MKDLQSTETSYSNILIMATSHHGVSLDRIKERRVTACGRPILRQALCWAHLWTDQTQAALYQDLPNPFVDLLYELIIQMTRCADRFVVGFGNIGENDMPHCCPTYAAFGLTEFGWERANRLFNRFPQYRSPTEFSN